MKYRLEETLFMVLDQLVPSGLDNYTQEQQKKILDVAHNTALKILEVKIKQEEVK